MTNEYINIENRIPKIKEKRRKRAKKRLILYLTFFFTLLFVIIYFQSPISKINTIKVHGNNYITKEDIIEKSNIKINETSFVYFSREDTKNSIEQINELEEIRFEREFPSTLHIYVEELDTVGYLYNESTYYPLLENGELLLEKPLEQPDFNVPILTGWTNNEGLQELALEMQNVDDSIVMNISEIVYNPSETNNQKIIIYMNDGNEVRTVIDSLAEKISNYPSLVAKLGNEEKGIFHLEVGAYFTPYVKKVDEDEINDENN